MLTENVSVLRTLAGGAPAFPAKNRATHPVARPLSTSFQYRPRRKSSRQKVLKPPSPLHRQRAIPCRRYASTREPHRYGHLRRFQPYSPPVPNRNTHLLRVLRPPI